MCSVTHQLVLDVQERETTDVTLRFKNVKDMELLMIELDLFLDSLHEEGWVVDCDD